MDIPKADQFTEISLYRFKKYYCISISKLNDEKKYRNYIKPTSTSAAKHPRGPERNVNLMENWGLNAPCLCQNNYPPHQ